MAHASMLRLEDESVHFAVANAAERVVSSRRRPTSSRNPICAAAVSARQPARAALRPAPRRGE
eukprot:2679433-Pyramimonas_sp.AAC.1